jgi:hypothetical protein
VHVCPLLARATPADVDLADFCGADRRVDAQQAMPAKAAPLFIRDGVDTVTLSKPKPLLADKLHCPSCQIVHRADDLDASFLFQFLQDWTTPSFERICPVR